MILVAGVRNDHSKSLMKYLQSQRYSGVTPDSFENLLDEQRANRGQNF
jgi:hypothetical protein